MCSFIVLWKIKFELISVMDLRENHRKEKILSCLQIHQPTLESYVGMIKKG